MTSVVVGDRACVKNTSEEVEVGVGKEGAMGVTSVEKADFILAVPPPPSLSAPTSTRGI